VEITREILLGDLKAIWRGKNIFWMAAEIEKAPFSLYTLRLRYWSGDARVSV
jgi:hypothetical protein